MKESPKEHSVTSAPNRSPKTVTLNVPTIRKPDIKMPESKRMRAGVLALAFVLTAIFGGMLGAWAITNRDDGLVTGSVSTEKKIVTSQSQLISQIAKTVGPSVVSINDSITSSSGSNPLDPFGTFGYSQPQQVSAAGTGIIITSGGLIVTNRHVVPAGTTNVSVTLSDGTELTDVSVVGRTGDGDSLDIAFLKINNAKGHKLSPATLGDSSKVEVGDDAVAIGNALGQFQNTVTSGIISGYGRSVQASDSSGSSSPENLDDLFQTDAAINEGNSGGPLVNLNGQVIGINTAVAGSGAQNIGFAIPINDVKGLVDQVVKTGKFSRPYLGVRYVSLTADVANYYGVSVTQGAFVAPSVDSSNPSVVSGSPADKAGIQARDVITAIGGTKVDSTHSLTSLLDQHQPGDTVTVTVIRGNDTKQIKVTLGSVPAN